MKPWNLFNYVTETSIPFVSDPIKMSDTVLTFQFPNMVYLRVSVQWLSVAQKHIPLHCLQLIPLTRKGGETVSNCRCNESN